MEPLRQREREKKTVPHRRSQAFPLRHGHMPLSFHALAVPTCRDLLLLICMRSEYPRSDKLVLGGRRFLGPHSTDALGVSIVFFVLVGLGFVGGSVTFIIGFVMNGSLASGGLGRRATDEGFVSMALGRLKSE